jgi:hypothetical protein
MPKALCVVGTVVAAVLLLIFGADLAIAIPFGRVSVLTDISFVICAGVLGFLSWLTLQEQT